MGRDAMKAEVQRRFIESVGHWFEGAWDTVSHGVVDAAKTVGEGVETAAKAVGHGVETAAKTVGEGVVDAAEAVGHAGEEAIDGIKDAAEDVGHAFETAAHEIAKWTGEATVILGPIVKEIGEHAGPIAEDLLGKAVEELKAQAPNILKSLGEAGVKKLAMKVLTHAAAAGR